MSSYIKSTILIRLIIGTILSCALISPAQSAVELDHIIAIVNKDVVMQSELQERLRTIKNQLTEQGTLLPPISILEKQVLDRLILSKLQVQMALKTGIRVDNETLNRTISNIAAENQLSVAQLREILESDNYSYKGFREDIRNEILLSRLKQRQVDNRVFVTEREIENYLSNQEYLRETDREYRIAHILIATPSRASTSDISKARETAMTVRRELVAGTDFGKLAVQYSEGAQALEGGDLGWRKAGQVPTLFADFITDMEEGDISEPITSLSGFHIIKLTGSRVSEVHVITQTHVRHILITPDELISDEDARSRLEQLKTRLKNGDDFAELTKGNSNDPFSAADGGDLGWISPGDLVPEFEQVMNRLKPGELSPIFKTQYGYHILEVLERREHDSTEDVKRARAHEAIRQRKLVEARENWLRQMRDEAYVEYRLNTQ